MTSNIAANHRVILMSTPAFGVATLNTLIARGYNVVGLVTQPDKPAGRGLAVVPPAMKTAALALGVPVFQPASLFNPEAIASLRATEPDLILVAAYGKFIPEEVCQLARLGAINLHPSLLPRWRGACPVVAAVLAGDSHTGLTVHFVVNEMDQGDILGQMAVPIGPEDTAEQLMERLGEMGGEFFLDTVEAWVAGRVVPQVQDNSQATWCDRMTKQQGEIDWQQPAAHIARQVRALTPWPGAFTYWQGKQLGIVEAWPDDSWQGSEEPGRVFRLAGELAVATGAGALRLRRVQLSGKRIVLAEQFERGAHGFSSALLGRQTE